MALVQLLLFEDRLQVLELVEEVPDVVAGALLPVRMQVTNLRIVAVAVKGCLRRPFDEDHHRARLDVACCGLSELAERDDAPAVRLYLLRGAARVGEILVAIRDVEEIERIYRPGHRSLQQ